MESTLLFLALLFFGMAVGISIAMSLVLSAVVLMWPLDFFNTQLLAQNLLAGFDNFPLLAVPFFILEGELMYDGGLTPTLTEITRAFCGHSPCRLGFGPPFSCMSLATIIA